MSDPSSSPSQKPRLPLWKLLLLGAIAGTALTGVLLVAGYYVLIALWFSGWGADAHYQGEPLYFDLGDVTTHTLSLGDDVVDLRVYSATSGDNGDAAIEVVVNGQRQGKLMSLFNYDLFSGDHPASYEVMDVDGDDQLDVVIHLRASWQESYVVSSRDSELYPYQARHNYPRPW